MPTLTFILGMERFNEHIWDVVRTRLGTDTIDVRLLRFHDGHVEQRDPALVTAIAEADVLFITLINARAQADWLADLIANHQVPTVFAFESMPEVMALTQVGTYRVTEGRGSLPKPMKALLQLITRGRDEDTLYAYTKLTKLTAKLLPLMPAKLADFRTWLSVNLYWNQPDAANLTQMVRLILRDCLGQPLDVAPVQTIPMMGCFHPASTKLFADPPAYLRWAKKTKCYRKGQPLVAVLGFRKHVVQEQRYLGDLVTTLERYNLAVLPIFVSGIEAHVAVREWLTRQPVDAIVNTMGFPLVGGPAGSTKPGQHQAKASDLLSGIDVPYMVAQPLQMQDEGQWHTYGVAPMQAVIMYDLPEMDGSIAPVVLGAIQKQQIVATPSRLERAAQQIKHWVHLRHTPAIDRRVAIVLYNYPPGLGKLATAALLDVPTSLFALLKKLREAGYHTGDLPASVDELAHKLAQLEQHDSGIPMPLRDYHRVVPANQARRVDDYWGMPPGEIAPAGPEALRIDGFQLGNIFVGVQPPMGIPGDPMRLLFDRSFTPHHQYIGFYRWLSEVWKADALLHFGMHGTSEWMPGLQLGLTEQCWPDVLLGAKPNLYLYPLNNPAEAAIARRRGYATIVSHAVPPYARAGLYKQLAQIRAELDSNEAGQELELDLPDLPRAEGESWPAYTQRVRAYLDQLEQRLIIDGLHVLGRAPGSDRAATLIEAALDVSRDGAPGLSELLQSVGVDASNVPPARREMVYRAVLVDTPVTSVWQDVLDAYGQPTMSHSEDLLPQLAHLIEHGRLLRDRLTQSTAEMDVLLHALEGGYVKPAPGADPVRAGAAALPSGRNIHSVDPWRLPSDSAYARGSALAEALLRRHVEDAGCYPQTVAQTLWALDTIKTEGESLAVVLTLVGARPARDGQGKIWRYELIPLAELGRPRVDVLLDISSIFRDTFQMSLDLLDDLFRRAASADEPLEQNYVRAHTLHLCEQGRSWEQATARIFTQAPGQYGTGVDEQIEASAWEETTQLTETYLHRGGHTYGGGRAGTPETETLRGLLGTVDRVFQAIDSVEYGLTDMQHYYGHSGALQLAARHVQDGRSPRLTYADVGAGFSATHTPSLRDADELLRIEARSKLLNPRWYEGMLSHGYAGTAEIGNRFTYLLGWGAVTDSVDAWIFDAAASTFILDAEMRARLEAANPLAVRNAVARLLEANGRGLWPADEDVIDQLQSIYGDLEDQLEAISTR
ncbi:MAG: magnesium chelatase subunit H [Chloroflexota bacterium]